MVATPHTAARRQRVAELTAAGKTPKEIAAAVGASLEVVYVDRLKVFPAAGRAADDGRRRRRARVQELAAAGRTPEQIAAELGVSANTVTKDLESGGRVAERAPSPGRGRRPAPPPDPLPAFDADRAAVFVRESARINGTVAARRAGLTVPEIRGWLTVGKRWRLPPFAAFTDAVVEARAERRAEFAARAARNKLATPAAVAALRTVLRRRLAAHFEQPHVRQRVTRALDFPRADFWPVLSVIEDWLFPDDGNGLVPASGLGRCSPAWLSALAKRLAGTPCTLTLPAL